MLSRQIVDSRLGSTELTLLLAAATAQILWSGDIQGVQDLQPFAQLIQLLDKQEQNNYFNFRIFIIILIFLKTSQILSLKLNS